MIDLFVKIIIGVTTGISFTIYLSTCFLTARTRSWLKLGLGILVTGLSLGIAVDGVLLVGGIREINRILVWGIAGGIFGICSFFSLWVIHSLIIPYLLKSISKLVETKQQNDLIENESPNSQRR